MKGGASSGEFISRFRKNSNNEQAAKISRFATSIPLVQGDSGSAVINQTGELVGVVFSTASVLGKRESNFTMMDIKKLKEIIEADRSEHASKEIP